MLITGSDLIPPSCATRERRFHRSFPKSCKSHYSVSDTDRYVVWHAGTCSVKSRSQLVYHIRNSLLTRITYHLTLIQSWFVPSLLGRIAASKLASRITR